MSARVLTLEGEWIDEDWQVVRDENTPVSPGKPTLLSLKTWLERKAEGASLENCSVWLAPDDDPATLAPDLATLPIIAVEFPRFFDGRGYSTARLLRRYDYMGELRAFGEVLIDQVFHLKRVGFTSFVLRADQNPDDAVASLTRYSNTYQGSTDNPLPLYRRRPQNKPSQALG